MTRIGAPSGSNHVLSLVESQAPTDGVAGRGDSDEPSIAKKLAEIWESFEQLASSIRADEVYRVRRYNCTSPAVKLDRTFFTTIYGSLFLDKYGQKAAITEQFRHAMPRVQGALQESMPELQDSVLLQGVPARRLEERTQGTM